MISHVINVTEINDSKKPSYLHVAQPVTFETMIRAKNVATTVMDVQLVAVKHASEQVDVPKDFVAAPDLDKYAWEYIDALAEVQPRKPLPRMVDILSSVSSVTDAEYVIYTNLDIGLYPNFYLRVKELIDDGYDAICINRVDLPKQSSGIILGEENIDLIYTVSGIPHGGIDCFVFKREIIDKLKLGNVYIGFPPVGQVLKTQIEQHSKRFLWVKDEKLTFHLGSDAPWSNVSSPYKTANLQQADGLYVGCFTEPPSAYRRVIDKLVGFGRTENRKLT